MKNILVAIDFVRSNNKLVDMTIQMAKAFGSKVWFVHIYAPVPEYADTEGGVVYIRDSVDMVLQADLGRVQDYVSLIQEMGIEAEGLVIQGATVKSVLEEAGILNADLIIAGHQKHGVLYNILMGDVSSGIVNRSSIPVLIVPSDE